MDRYTSTYTYEGSVSGASAEEILRNVKKSVDRFRGDWQVEYLTVKASPDEDVLGGGVYVAEFTADLLPKDA